MAPQARSAPLAVLARWLERYHSGDREARVPVDSLVGPRGNRDAVSLGHAFNEMADELAQRERTLDRFLETRAEFVSLVSHELRTPLTAIGGYVKLLLNGDAGPLAPTQRDFLSIVDTNVERLSHLVSDILDVEKMESGRIQVAREPQDLGAILAECHATFLPLARRKGLELQLKTREASVLGDRGRLLQIFMNLVSNAIKYTERGSVTLELEPREYAVVVRVRDTGPGMESDEVGKLFQKFYRTRSGLASEEVGTGLGLFLADRLVRAHGGSISFESLPGQGTVFEVTLPAIREGGAEGPEAASAPRGELGVWIFDSAQADTDRISGVLEAAAVIGDGRRIRVRSFARLEDAPAAEDEKEVPGLIILDPRAAAYDLAAVTRLRARAGGTIPMLVVSASLDTAVAFAEGSSAILTKPIDDRELLIAIRELLQARPRRVLVADRSRDLSSLLRSELGSHGIQVDEVDRGSLVLERLQGGGYDLVLLDAELPGAGPAPLFELI
ncbi:MAG TPA: ATP-binding protein, partial [Bdellovibrionota bacterium]|nr:ATP-binding protein [Bdellovibrionota bacterium]